MDVPDFPALAPWGFDMTRSVMTKLRDVFVSGKVAARGLPSDWRLTPGGGPAGSHRPMHSPHPERTDSSAGPRDLLQPATIRGDGQMG